MLPFRTIGLQRTPLQYRGVVFTGANWLQLSQVIAGNQTNASGLASFWWKGPSFTGIVPAPRVLEGKQSGIGGEFLLDANYDGSGNHHPECWLSLTNGSTASRFRPTNFGAINVWHHGLVGWNNGATHVWFDNQNLGMNIITPLNPSATVRYDYPTWTVGRGANGQGPFTGEIAELWLRLNSWIDITVEANRRLFITADNKPVNLGTFGDRPGLAPQIYLSVNQYQDAGIFAYNRGTPRGIFTINGGLTKGTTEPVVGQP
jgi:hypothetical protein